jgi:hypothetical protein
MAKLVEEGKIGAVVLSEAKLANLQTNLGALDCRLAE